MDRQAVRHLRSLSARNPVSRSAITVRTVGRPRLDLQAIQATFNQCLDLPMTTRDAKSHLKAQDPVDRRKYHADGKLNENADIGGSWPEPV